MTSSAHTIPKVPTSERHLARWPTILAAALCPLLYFAFVWHFSVDALQFDDWNFVNFLSHFTWHGLWSQYGQSRIPVPRLVFLAVAHTDHFDTRTVMFISALALIGAYVLILVCFQYYLRHPLGPLAVLSFGLVWFSLADTQNALWAANVGWYLVLLWLGVMMLALLLPHRQRNVWFGVAIAAAVVASLTESQGFVLWPLGLVALAWLSRPLKLSVVWCASALVTTSVYLVGYDSHNNACNIIFSCRQVSLVGHPLQAMQFFVIVLGEIVPAPYSQNTAEHPGSFLYLSSTSGGTRVELLGIALLLVGVYVVVASIRQRRSTEQVPLPLLLIGFAFLFDLTITWGRFGGGSTDALLSDRYSMVGLVFVSGLLIYAWRHVHPVGKGRVFAGVICMLLAIQVVGSITIGWTSATNTRVFLSDGARVVDNLERIPPASRACELDRDWVLLPGVRRSGFAEFAPDQVRSNQALGPPPMIPSCRPPPSR